MYAYKYLPFKTQILIIQSSIYLNLTNKMSFYDGIFDPQFKNSPLPRRKHIYPLKKAFKLRPNLQFNFSPKLSRYFKATQLLSKEKSEYELSQTYTLHKQEHPNCSILPAIKQELTKKSRNLPSVLNFPSVYPQKPQRLTSKTPDPVLSFINTLKISKIKNPKELN